VFRGTWHGSFRSGRLSGKIIRVSDGEAD